VTVGGSRRNRIVVLKFLYLAFVLRPRELHTEWRRRVRRAPLSRLPLQGRHSGSLFPWRNDAVVAAVPDHRRDENDRRVGREAPSRVANQPVDLTQTKRLQPGRQFPTKLIQRFAALLGGAPLGQLVLLPHDTDDKQDPHGRGDQDGGQQECNPPQASPSISGTHGRYCRRTPLVRFVMEMYGVFNRPLAIQTSRRLLLKAPRTHKLNR